VFAGVGEVGVRQGGDEAGLVNGWIACRLGIAASQDAMLKG